MVILQKKLKRLKVYLKAFNQLHFFGILLKIKEKIRDYEAAQVFNLTNPSMAQIEQERGLAEELHALMLDEESFYK